MSQPRNTTTRDQHRNAIKRTKPSCGICEQEIDYTLKWPDPWCFVVDHIEPLGKNPSPERIAALDVLTNKQAAHHKCNRDKWDKTSETTGPRVFITSRIW